MEEEEEEEEEEHMRRVIKLSGNGLGPFAHFADKRYSGSSSERASSIYVLGERSSTSSSPRSRLGAEYSVKAEGPLGGSEGSFDECGR